MVASLNGVRLLRSAPIRWGTKPGLMPSTSVVMVDEAVLDQATDVSNTGTGTTTVTRDDPGGGVGSVLRIGERRIARLFITGVGAGTGTAEHVSRGVALADRRHLWRRKKYTAAFNVRRRTGQLRFANGEDITPVANTIPILRYKPQTLNGSTPWTLKAALEKVMNDTGQAPFVIEDGFPDVDAFGARGYQQEGTLSEIIGGLLRFAPNWQVTCDDDGTIRFYDVSNLEAENEIKEAFQPRLFGGGFDRLADYSFDRPSEIDIYFVAEPEIRWDYEEAQDIIFANSSPVDAIDALADVIPPAYLESAYSVPVNGMEIYGEATPQGSEVNLHAFLNALSESELYPRPDFAEQDWDLNTILRVYLRWWEAQKLYVTRVDGPDIDWAKITRTTVSALHTRFRPSRDWQDRFRDIKAVRAHLEDAASLTRRRSPIYADYTTKPRMVLNTGSTATSYPFGLWIQQGSVQEALANCKRSPARATPPDKETGIFSVRFRRIARMGQMDIFPVIPVDIPRIINNSNLRVAIIAGQSVKPDYKLTTVMTTMPQPMPGGRSHLYKITVRPNEAAAAAKLQQNRFGECKGPRMEFMIPESALTTARFVWSDDASERLRAPFFDPQAEWPRENLQNRDDVLALARLTAAAIWSSMMDRGDGAASMPAIKQPPGLGGSASNITTTAAPGANKPITTSVSFGASIPRFNPINRLPPDVRDRLLQTIIPPAGV